jgi:hypothetical protein
VTTWQRWVLGSLQPAFSICAIAAVRALTSASPPRLPIACLTSGVTSRIAVTISACWPGHFFSAARVAATKPFSSRSLPSLDRFDRQSATQ